MDAIISVCDDLTVELEDVRKFVSPMIKNKIEAEAMVLNYLPRQNTLPILKKMALPITATQDRLQ